MSETETEGMYTDLGDIVDPGVSPEDDGTGQSDPSDVVDPDVWSDEDGAGADGGLLGDLDLGDIADQLL
jgi:hypothetical protein